MTEQHHVYNGHDRKDVEVLVDGTWYAGLLHSWDQAEDGSWSGMVEWTTEPGSTYLQRKPAERIRPAPSQ